MPKEVDIHKMTEELYKPLSETGKFLYDKKTRNLFFKNKLLPVNDKNDIIKGAQALKNILVFNLLLEELEAIACEKIYKDSADNIKVLEGGKWILWTVDVLRKKVDSLSQIK